MIKLIFKQYDSPDHQFESPLLYFLLMFLCHLAISMMEQRIALNKTLGMWKTNNFIVFLCPREYGLGFTLPELSHWPPVRCNRCIAPL